MFQFLSVLMLMNVLVGGAFSEEGESRVKPGQPLRLSGVGHVYPNSGFPALTLKYQTENSPLIVEGEVASNLGSRSYGRFTETDFEIAVTIALKKPENTAAITKLVIAQIGGKVGDFEIINPNDPLLQVGGKYFFFLKEEDRKDLPEFWHATLLHPRYR